MPTFDSKRLYSALLNSGLQVKDPALYQVIYQLIGALVGTQNSINSGFVGGGSSSSTVSEITNIFQIISGTRTESSSPNRVVPGPQGAKGDTGAAGATGATLPGPLGIIKHYTEMYPRYTPIVGNQGNPGTTGAQGPMGAVITPRYVEMSRKFFQIFQGSSSSSGGKLVQVVNTETGASTTGTNAIPMDDTIPQITEGDEYMTLAITPTSATNKLKIEVVGVFWPNNPPWWITVALFQDATANALAAAIAQASGIPIMLTHYMTAGTTSSTTFRVRAGRHSAAGTSITFNGDGARRMGGVMASSITISEIVP